MSAKPLILVAEDSAPNRKILAHLLEKLGFEVAQCENGRQALDILTVKPDMAGKVVMVISDVMMPQMDGIEFLRQVRGNEALKKIPFVLVTAVAEKQYVTQAIELAVNGYILKPITFQKVRDKIKELCPQFDLSKVS